jgi:NDP-sugar pyrophosphorylase family protein
MRSIHARGELTPRFHSIDVVVLAGGRGTRLAPYTTVLPKPLMPIREMPVLEILLRRLSAAGFQRVHLAVGYLGELIEAYFRDGERFGVELSYLREDAPLGTAGPLAEIANPSEQLLVMNGDLFTSLDFRALVRCHEENHAVATIATLQREVPIDFGVIKLDGARITGFNEKPTLTYDVSMGVYVFEREVIDLIPRRERFDFPDLLLKLLGRGSPVAAYRSTDFWLDIGRREDYELAQERFDELGAELLGDKGRV